MCFANHENGDKGFCLVYFGEQKNKFIKEFKKYEPVMVKAK
jgi:hypothetical protein